MENKIQEHEDQSKNPSTKHPKFVKWALLAGIVIILNVFFFVVQQIVLPVPDHSAYCPSRTTQARDAVKCKAQNGVWTEYQTPPPSMAKELSTDTVSGYCNYFAKCQPAYEKALSGERLYSFILMTVLGVIVLVIGLIPIGSSIVSSGLSYGGVVALILGSMQYWGEADNWLRLAISAIALFALIWVGMRRFRDE